MAIGGLYMSGIRAVVIVVLGTVVFDVQFAVSDWPLLAAVFLLTLGALYGLGMLLASVFLAWGREAWHMANLLQEPVYFLAGMYAPVRVLGPIAGVAIGILPLAVGLDAMRQLAFAGGAAAGVLPPAVEALILVAMAVVFVLLARGALAALEMRARRDGRLVARWQ
jgi:ABC-2 type transport system permease protein